MLGVPTPFYLFVWHLLYKLEINNSSHRMNNSTEGTKGCRQWFGITETDCIAFKGRRKGRFYSQAGVWTQVTLMLDN